MRSSTLARAAIALAAVLVVSAVGSASAANAISGVQVVNKPDRVVITVSADRPLSFVPLRSAAGKYIGFHFQRALAVKGRVVPIRSGGIYSVRYSNFTSSPPTSRIVVNTGAQLAYATQWSPDKRRLEIHVMKAGFKPAAGTPEPKAKPAADAEPQDPPTSAQTPSEPSTVDEPSASAAPQTQEDRRLVYRMIAERSRRSRAASESSDDGSRPISTASAAQAICDPKPTTSASDSRTSAQPETRVMGMTETRTAPAEPVATAQPSEPGTRLAESPPPAARPTQGERKISVNFLAADINDVLKALSVQSGKNIVAGKDVTGNVTVSLSNVSLEEALDYVARLSGFTYTKDNDTYLVSTRDNLRTLTSGSGPDTKTEIVRLSYAKADDVMALLKARFPDVTVNKVGVEAAPKGAAEPQPGQTQVGLKNNLLVLAGPEVSVTEARKLAQQFEDTLRVQSIESTRTLYRVKFANPAQLAQSVMALVPGVEVVFAPTSDFELVKFKSAKATSGQAPQVERDFDNSGKQAAASKDAAAGADKTEGRPTAPVTNARTLVIVGDPKSVEKALEVAAQLDIKSPQIKIDSKITSISESGEKKLGFTWQWGDYAAVEGFTDYEKTTDTAPGPENKQNVRIPHDRMYRAPWSFSATLDALLKSGDAQLLASPSIVCLERNPGVFFVGDEVTYIQRIEVTPTGQNIITDTKRVGVQMVVVGEINDDGYITLYLHPEVSTLKLAVEQGVTLPIVSSRFTDHVVRVKSGETIVIGGLIRNDEIEEMSKVPILGDLPLLGHLFKHKYTTKDHTEVVMFITATTLQD